MKTSLYTGLLIVICNYAFAQTAADKALQIWMHNRGYIALSDTSDLPKALMPWYKIIITQSQVSDYYVLKNSVVDNAKSLYMVILPISAIRTTKMYLDKIMKPEADTLNAERHIILNDFDGTGAELLLSINKAHSKITLTKGHF